MKIFVFLAVIVVACSAASSYCNSGACTTTADCDLGFCCGGKCVSTPPTALAKDATCNISNYCQSCVSTQYCDYQTSKCIDFKAPTCKYTFGCKCATGTDCTSGYCASDSTCRSTGLNPGDLCVDNAQCGSTVCTSGVCVGAAVNGTCSVANYLSKECAYGLTCSYVGLNQECVQAAAQGGNCSLTQPCGEAWSSCVKGTCGEMYSGAVGDACLSLLDCQQPGVCTSSKCAAPPTGECKSGVCGLNQACVCAGTTGTNCANSYNWCSTQYLATAACLRKNKCSDSEAGAWADDSCAMKNCQTELIAESCCRYCGTGSNNLIVAPVYGLDCVAKTYKLTQVCDGTCQTAFSKCASSGSTATASGSGSASTTNGNGNSASSVAASILLIVAMIAMLL